MYISGAKVHAPTANLRLSKKIQNPKIKSFHFLSLEPVAFSFPELFEHAPEFPHPGNDLHFLSTLLLQSHEQRCFLTLEYGESLFSGRNVSYLECPLL
ncbi:hypothetical protein ES332_A02G163600v1 [Gossypium tomentosum]|uniref:Uncharacterized protein n=1 Tax=Gossypium tomentosum TaxID=34277 RepID=A0A5D2RJ21_GOSTO|nr:hypothetical protein ES332_A02G163600v1 [Gossypium tomentosum]